MADTSLPTEYDAIILGTGLTESILAAALSRIGQKVLHFDRNDYYSGDWATFHFRALREWIDNKDKNLLEAKNSSEELNEGEKLWPLNVNSSGVTNVSEKAYVPLTDPVESSESSAQQTCKHNTSSGSTDEQNADGSDEQQAASSGSQDSQSTEQSGDASQTDMVPTADVNSSPSVTAAPEIIPTPGESDDNKLAESQTKDPKEEKTREQPKIEWSLSKIESLWRRFNIDLMPKILFSRGPMVELLISSDIAKYCEFRAITRILTFMGDTIQQVPCSRADVFSSKQVNMIEKRMLMKLLTFCMDYENHPDEFKGYEDKPFIDFLKSKKLSANVLHYVFHAIAMATEMTSTLEGLKNTQKFIKSLGRYGNTAFLWPLYGSGELPQCFCRMCAVFGGVYCLRRTAQNLIVNSENICQGVIDTEGLRLSAKWVVMEASYAAENLKRTESQRKISRAILLTDRSIYTDTEKQITLLSLPSVEGGTSPVTLYELSSLSMACPDNLFVTHIIAETVVDAETDLMPIVKNMFDIDVDSDKTDGNDSSKQSEGDSSKPKVLWSVMFNVVDSSGLTLADNIPCNVRVVNGPNIELDMDAAIHQARSIFEEICPDEEFLPKAPNPEDIIFDGSEGGSGFAPEDGAKQSDLDSSQADTAAQEEPESKPIDETSSETQGQSTVKDETLESTNETQGQSTVKDETLESTNDKPPKDDDISTEKET